MEALINPVLPENIVDDIIETYKGKPGMLLKVLEAVQSKNTYKYLPEETLKYIAKRLSMTYQEVLKFADMFTYFNLQPQGKSTIVVCCGTSCHAKRSKALLDELGSLLGYSVLNVPKESSYTTPDYKYTIKYQNCIGDCDNAPLMTVDGIYHNNMNYYKMAKILKPKV